LHWYSQASSCTNETCILLPQFQNKISQIFVILMYLDALHMLELNLIWSLPYKKSRRLSLYTSQTDYLFH
jgi:hypothetical protein